MYQKLLVAMMSLTIGVCGGIRYGSTEAVPGCFGLLYPGLCYMEGTYQAVDPEAEEAAITGILEPEQIIIRWKLLELLSE